MLQKNTYLEDSGMEGVEGFPTLRPERPPPQAGAHLCACNRKFLAWTLDRASSQQTPSCAELSRPTESARDEASWL